MSNYLKGRAFEYQIKDFLERNHYLVLRMAGSHSPFDLIAINGDEIKFIQAKEVKNKSKINHVVKEVENSFTFMSEFLKVLENIVVFVYLYLKVDRDKIYVYKTVNGKLQLIGYYKLNEFSIKPFAKAFSKGFSGESGDGKKMPSAFSMNNPSPPPKEIFSYKENI